MIYFRNIPEVASGDMCNMKDEISLDSPFFPSRFFLYIPHNISIDQLP